MIFLNLNSSPQITNLLLNTSFLNISLKETSVQVLKLFNIKHEGGDPGDLSLICQHTHFNKGLVCFLASVEKKGG